MADPKQTPKRYNPSALMSAYNEVKRYARRSGAVDPLRVDRAFGYLMGHRAQEKWMEYATTLEVCGCPDSALSHNLCKHSLSLAIDQRHDELMAEFLGQAA